MKKPEEEEEAEAEIEMEKEIQQKVLLFSRFYEPNLIQHSGIVKCFWEE